jgi:hypothetical protein
MCGEAEDKREQKEIWRDERLKKGGEKGRNEEERE